MVKSRPISFDVNENNCFIITSHKRKNGLYPEIQDAITHERSSISRKIYEECYGIIPENMNVCHHCDDPLCINPEHLFLGTHADNVKDMVMKGRQARGEKRPNAILKEKEVIEIRNSDLGNIELANQYNVTPACIINVKYNHSWKHVGGRKKSRKRLTIEQVRELRNDNHLSIKDIAIKYNVSESTISQIRNRRTWQNI